MSAGDCPVCSGTGVLATGQLRKERSCPICNGDGKLVSDGPFVRIRMGIRQWKRCGQVGFWFWHKVNHTIWAMTRPGK